MQDRARRIHRSSGICGVRLRADAVLGPSIADSATIPCFIQEGLDSLWQGPVRVENRARPGWTSTQALIDLVLSLRSGAKPDLVLFIGGFEDAAAA